MFDDFHQLWPLGRVGLVVTESVCVCLSPCHATFFEASHWSSDHMIRSRPLIGGGDGGTVVVQLQE